MTHYELSDKLATCKNVSDKIKLTPELIKLADESGIKLQGLYCIRNNIFVKTYYGQTKNIQKVYRDYLDQLKNKSPRFPPEMHYDYIDFGKDSFEFYILKLEENYYERCRKRESYLSLDENVYNIWKNRS